MVRPQLLYLYEEGDAPQTLEHWPEIGRIELLEARDQYLQNFCMGGRHDLHGGILAIRRGSEYGLRYLRECLTGVRVVALYGEQRVEPEWLEKLHDTVIKGDMHLTDLSRHGVVGALGEWEFHHGLISLRKAVEYIRGEAIRPSEAAMRSESGLTRAIEILAANGYWTPRS